MLRFWICLALLSLPTPWLLSSPAQAAAVRYVDNKEAARLVQALSDPRFLVRTQALIRLEKMGPAVLPQLRNVLAQEKDPEVRRHLETIIPKLEHQLALAPTRITLDLKDVTLNKAAAEIAQQSGYKIEMYPHGGVDPEKQLVTIQLQNATFWEAIGKLCEAGGFTLHEYYGPESRMLRLMPGDHYPGCLCLSGAFRVMVRNFYHYRTLDFSNSRNGGVPELRRTETLTVNFSISAEPRMPLLGAGYPTITEAIDDQGQSLRLPPQPRQQTHFHGYRSYMHNVQAQLATSANGRRLRALKGTIPVTVVCAQRPQITVEKLHEVKNKTFKQGTTTMQIENVRYDGSQTNITMTISEAARAGSQDYTWSQTLLQRLEVVDEKGNKLQNYGGNWNGGVNTLQGTFTFGSMGGRAKVGKGVKLVLYEWNTVTHNVPFEFEDIPLP